MYGHSWRRYAARIETKHTRVLLGFPAPCLACVPLTAGDSSGPTPTPPTPTPPTPTSPTPSGGFTCDGVLKGQYCCSVRVCSLACMGVWPRAGLGFCPSIDQVLDGFDLCDELDVWLLLRLSRPGPFRLGKRALSRVSRRCPRNNHRRQSLCFPVEICWLCTHALPHETQQIAPRFTP